MGDHTPEQEEDGSEAAELAGVRRVSGRAPKQHRSAVTRQRLIDAAIEEFGRRGFAATGTRALVERANVNLTAIHYHFGSKAEVYRAAVSHVERALADRFAACASRAQERLGGRRISRLELVDVACNLVDDLIVVSAVDLPASWYRFIRTMAPHDVDAIRNAVRPVYDALFDVIARVIRGRPESTHVRLLAISMIRPYTALPLTHEDAYHLIGWDRVTPNQHALVRQASRAVVSRLLGANGDSRAARRH